MTVTERPTTEISSWVATIAGRILDDADAVVDGINAAVAQGAPAMMSDPAITHDTTASNRVIVLHFLHSVAVHPDSPVPVQTRPEGIVKARNLVRRGIELEVLIQAYRFGQEALWRRWIQVASDVVEDRTELVEVLSRSSDLIFSYVNDSLAMEVAEVQNQHDELNHGGLTRRAETIRLLIDGAPMDTESATRRLGYPLIAQHTFVAMWSPDAAPEALERAAGELAGLLDARWVSHPAGAGQIWLWLTAGSSANRDALRAAAAGLSTAPRVLIGPTASGPEGFRQAQSQTIAVQRLAMTGATGDDPLTYDELVPAALATEDPAKAAQFVRDVLGELAGSDPALETLRTTVRIHLEEGESAPRAAARLFTHRNTVLQRLARAETLMGRPIAPRRLQVFLALDVAHRAPEVLVPD
ncbi:helix-turn-helix domain-containing protein [Gordonia sp. CPCC 205515]|uniref:PucR family transcriptional regulator n=1 Tax=Gordonia sp. CPCC 205515 TaxID=3140791 RepID=UPI003AF402F2